MFFLFFIAVYARTIAFERLTYLLTRYTCKHSDTFAIKHKVNKLVCDKARHVRCNSQLANREIQPNVTA